MLRRLIAPLLLFTAGPLAAAPQPGQWVVRTQGGVIWIFGLERAASGWSASWTKPTHVSFGSNEFSGIGMPAITSRASQVREVEDDLEITFQDPRPGEMPAVFRIHTTDATHGAATLVGAPFAPFPLLRVESAALGPFDPQGHYALIVDLPTNAEMTRIFEADQAARSDPGHIDWTKVAPQDAARRRRVQALLDAGQLQSAEDFYHAAFLFQHGDKPMDFLKAHLFAMVALTRGMTSASWIAAATLDRYLDSVGQPQVFGTKLQIKDGKAVAAPATQGEALVPASVREALDVPSPQGQLDVMNRMLGNTEPLAAPDSRH